MYVRAGCELTVLGLIAPDDCFELQMLDYCIQHSLRQQAGAGVVKMDNVFARH